MGDFQAIAVIGMACRFPQAPNPGAYWRLLRGGVDAITEAPESRWPREVLPEYRFGGFLEDVDRFDPAFFGISPREAAAMDPQQRLLLELSWEALEDARIVPAALRDSATGVFVGAIWDDYATLQRLGGIGAITAHSVTGLHRSILANRVSYTLGLRGPSLAIDSGQSSSLVAVYQACESLAAGESELALAGGVNLNILAETTLATVAFGGLSPDGRCKTFDAGADGYARGEGGGVVLLKPLEAALADGDRVYCVIRGGAVANDGATDGLTVPGENGQRDVLTRAYQRAGVTPEQVQYVELHGTGTKVGDPIEASALGAVLGRAGGGRDRAPLLVGSAKTNIGHLEGAAGVAGLLKAALGLAHGEIPASLNFRNPNPAIDLDGLGLEVVTELREWPGAADGRTAGVSSFGMGGTTCHLVLSAGPKAAPAAIPGAAQDHPPVVVLPLSGTDAAAVKRQARAILPLLADGADPADVAYSLATTRTAFRERAVVVATEPDTAVAAVRALAAGKPAAGVVRGKVEKAPAAFLFTGQGSQRPGMGRELAAAAPAFAAALDEACQALRPHLDRPLLDVMWAEPGTPEAALLDQTGYTQPALFALEVALYRLAESWGLRPGQLAGHSVGELAAAHVAGVLSLADAAALVAARGRLMQALPAGGAMVSVEASEAEVRALLADLDGAEGADLAAVNGPTAVVVSGDAAACARIAEAFAAQGRKTKALTVSHAFHSPLMEPMLDDFRAVAASLDYRPAQLPIVSTLTGWLLTDAELASPDYWTRHVRGTVRFADALATLHDAGARTFLELGPSGVLTAMGPHTLPEAAFLAALGRGAEPEAAFSALAALHTRGAALDWDRVLPGRTVVDLPTYQFGRRRYWTEPASQGSRTVTLTSGSDTAQESESASAEPMPPAGDRAALAELVRGTVALILGHADAGAVDPALTFKELGFDSLTSVELRDRLTEATGRTLPAGLVYNFPTLDEVVDLLTRTSVQPAGSGPAGSAAPPAADPAEPIAIVAMACRYPGGADTPEALWQLVAEGRQARSPFPGDRGWDLSSLFSPDGDPDRPGTTYVRHGGFLAGADRFDPGFFGISPREAAAMDPQQRILLELAWESFERAGLDPAAVRGSDVGVFVGVTDLDYGPRLHEAAEGYDGYLLTGGATSVASGRIAYTFGLGGPAVTIDTACSSSLVGLHYAVQSLRQGECSLALGGGAAVMATPGMFVEFSRQHGLSADGLCKAFSASADGTAWAEGAGLLLLERLSDARRNGHPVLAVIRGSGVNQDGASNGLTAPSGPAQERVIRRALASAGLAPRDVDAVEAHGTGTALGDPIEAEALLAVYGRDRDPERPLRLGSMKSNIGHTQAAAGVGGVIKMVQALRHGLLPRTLHVDEPTPHVDWSSGAVTLLTEPAPWQADGRPRRAAVSSFGISGTNAHLIVEEAPESADAPSGSANPETPAVTGPIPLVLSAKTPEALAARAEQISVLLAAGDADPVAVGATLAARRPEFEVRAVAVGRDPGELVRSLAGVAEAVQAPGGALPVVPGGRTAFLFSGQGSQRPGMGRELYGDYPVFAASVDETVALLGIPGLREVMFAEAGTDEAALLNQTGHTQPALFVLEVALFRLLESWGVVPDFLIGHSVGELAAAHVAGVLSLADACKLVAARAGLMQALPPGGAMLAVRAPESRVRELLTDLEDQVSLAAVNGPTSMVLAGDTEPVRWIGERLSADGVRTKLLNVSHAFHSPRMEPMLAEFAAVAESLTYAEPRIPVVSNLDGRMAGDAVSQPGYWVRHVREAVRFADGVATLREAGVTRFLELGPDGVLTGMAQDILTDLPASSDPVIAALLRRGQEESPSLLAALGRVYSAGATVGWDRMFEPGYPRVTLPTYPFQRRRFWIEPGRATDPSSLGLAEAGHPLLGAAVAPAESGGLVLTGTFSRPLHRWLADHVIHGSALIPGAALVELALHAGRMTGAPVLEELTLQAPLLLPETAAVRVQVSVGAPDAHGRRPVAVHSRLDGPDEDGAVWSVHARGFLGADGPVSQASTEVWPPVDAQALDPDDVYQSLALRGYEYGPAFRNLRAVWDDGRRLHAEIELGPETAAQADDHLLHPALMDAALHIAVLRGEGTLIPFAWSDVAVHAVGARRLRVSYDPSTRTLEMFDPAGEAVAVIGTLDLRPATREQLAAARSGDPLHQVRWTPVTIAGDVDGSAADSWIELDGDGAALAALETVPETVVTIRSAQTDTAAKAHAATANAIAGGNGVTKVDGVTKVNGAAPATDPAARAEAAANELLDLLRAWLADPRTAASRLVVVTHGAAGPDAGPDLVHAPLWGLVRCAQLEQPGRLVLVDTDRDPRSRAVLAAAIASGEEQLAVRGGEVFAPRLARLDAPSQSTDDQPLVTQDRSVLITGGTGTLGGLVARHLVTEHGVRRLILCGRRGNAAEGMAELLAELTEAGADAVAVACDTSDRAALAAVLAEHRPAAIFHAAGAVADGTVETTTPDRLASAFRGKAGSAWLLHDLAAELELDLTAFVLFSSVVATVGNGGQSGYGAANAFLDALAAHRRALGLPATAIGWGLWQHSSGITGRMSRADVARLGRSGVAQVPTASALAMLDDALRLTGGHLLAARFDLAGLRARAAEGTLPPIFGDLVPRPAKRAAAAGGGAEGGWAARLAAIPAEQRGAEALALVRAQAASVLGHADASAVDERLAFKDLGFDSLTGVELRTRLAAATGLKLPSTVVFDQPTPTALAAWLAGQAADTAGTGAARARKAPAVRTAAADDPIAIVGMGCRYPGDVASPEDLWNLVAGGVDAIGGFPTDRGWDEGLYDPDPEAIGHSSTRFGGFLHDAGLFDAAFFGMSPREALATDPQQRILLEVAWEALEGAGLKPSSLRGSRTGVFTGVMYGDYGSRLHRAPDGYEGFLLTGNLGSVLSGRLAYVFGLNGPAITLDTACSSSLVALQLAGSALRNGECDLALAGGVTVMATPHTFVEFSRQRGLSADGRCKSFGANADGTGWAEGAGLLVLERLSDARRNGHQVLAVIRGAAVNQDGASNGLTAPNGPAQEQVIRDALAQAGLRPDEVDAVEAHGTGTRLGDPIEANALLATYGSGREADRPLYLGSLKSNIGHSQAAAGVGGVIKMVMAMRHGVLPRTLHADELSPHVDWSGGELRLLTEELAWPDHGRPRRAGVSSFGISGTNAHVVIEAGQDLVPSAAAPVAGPDAEADAPGAASAPVPLLVSAPDAESVLRQAAHLADFLEAAGPDLDLPGVGSALALTRTAFDYRTAVVGADVADLVHQLRTMAPDAPARPASGGTVFLFSGQGSQRPGMGRELSAAHPVFAGALAAVADRVDPFLEIPLRTVMFADAGTPEAARLDQTLYTQTALFAYETAVYRLLQHWGVQADLLIGHSIGELAAAHAAGSLSLDDACALVLARARLMQDLPAGGGMAAIEATEDEVAAAIAGQEDRLAIAAVNGPASVVVSGDTGLVQAVADDFSQRGRRVRTLAVSHAFHSPHMEPMLAAFREACEKAVFTAPRIPVVSNLTGDIAIDEEFCDPGYWVRHVREAVRFRDGAATVDRLGTARYLEIGPGGVLSGLVASAAPENAVLVAAVSRRDRPEAAALAAALADLHAHGAQVDWSAFFTGTRPAPLPTYAFHHERYWLDARRPVGSGAQATGHPLADSVVTLADGGRTVLTGAVSRHTHPWLVDHAVSGTVLLPAAALVELALNALGGPGSGRIEELTIERPAVLPDHGALQLQVLADEPDAEGRRSVAVYSRAAADDEWTRHASGTLTAEPADGAWDWAAAWPPAGAELDLAGVYEELDDAGYGYGPAFRGLRRAWQVGDDRFAEIALPDGADPAGFGIHPALLDSALHLIALESARTSPGAPSIPFSWADVTLHAAAPASARVRLSGTEIAVAGPHGEPILTVGTLTTRQAALGDASAQTASALFALEWQAPDTPEGATATTAAVLGGPRAGLPGVADLAELAALADTEGGVPALVFRFCDIGAEPDLPGKTRALIGGVLADVQQWIAEERFATSRLVLVTTDAFGGPTGPAGPDGAEGSAGSAASPASASIWGLVRSAQAEQPGRLQLVDTDGSPASTAALVAAAASQEPQLALRAGKVSVPRAVRLAVPEAGSEESPFRGRRVLVTGGTGALGSLVARHLAARHGVGSLVLAARRGADAPGAAELLADLSAAGVKADIVACDVSDRDQVAELLRDHPAEVVVHTAGVTDDGVVGALDADRFDRVLRPKADAAWHLHHVAAELGLDLSAFVLFSSLAGVVGTGGQANYAAGNMFLDALAGHRHALGLPATSIAWGLWADGSDITDRLAEADRSRLARQGILPIDAGLGLALFDASVAAGLPAVVAARLDRAALRAQAEAGTLAPTLRALVPARAAAGQSGGGTGGSTPGWPAKLAGLAPEQAARTLTLLVRAEVAATLGHASEAAVPADKAWKDLGLDSLTAVELRNRLGAAAGLRLPATVVFDHPTPAGLAAHLLGLLAPAEDQASAAAGEVDMAVARLEAALAALPAGLDPADLVRFGDRISILASAFPGSGRPAPAGATRAPAADLDEASDEDLFALLDLGR